MNKISFYDIYHYHHYYDIEIKYHNKMCIIPRYVFQMKMESEDSNPPDSSQSHPVELTTTPQEQRMEYSTEHLNLPTPHHVSKVGYSYRNKTVSPIVIDMNAKNSSK